MIPGTAKHASRISMMMIFITGTLGIPTKVAIRLVCDCARHRSFVKNWTGRNMSRGGMW
jgi:hypothetical protein